MKKNTKGALAVGAAALLLAGGAGTMAAWSDSASLDGGAVTSGHLRITELADEGGWTWGTAGVAQGTEFDPGNDRIVPGDVVQYTGTYKLEVLGDNLVASLTPTVAGLTGDAELIAALTFASVSDTTDLDLANITDADDGKQVSITTTITFNDVNDQVGADQTVQLSDASIVLQQTAPAGPTP